MSKVGLTNFFEGLKAVNLSEVYQRLINDATEHKNLRIEATEYNRNFLNYLIETDETYFDSFEIDSNDENYYRIHNQLKQVLKSEPRNISKINVEAIDFNKYLSAVNDIIASKVEERVKIKRLKSMKVLLSIKPEFVQEIIEGRKKFEYRKRVFKRADVSSVVVYATKPYGKVVGEFEVEDILEEELDQLWSKTRRFSGITKEFFYDYTRSTGRRMLVSCKTPVFQTLGS